MTDQSHTWMGFQVYDRSNWPPDVSHASEGGVILIDKHLGATSFTIVRKIRRYLGIKKVGHAGTLDPAAEGLLIVCFGKATKTIQHIQDLQKEYVAGIVLGRETPSGDRETPVCNQGPFHHIDQSKVDQVIEQQFTGRISQVPPMYSALKVEGQPLYKKARKGETVDLKAREVYVYRWDRLLVELPLLLYRITCSKGTYIRSLAYDLGRALGTFGTLGYLRRTAIGHFGVDNALIQSDFEVRP